MKYMIEMINYIKFQRIKYNSMIKHSFQSNDIIKYINHILFNKIYIIFNISNIFYELWIEIIFIIIYIWNHFLF